ncbi:MAG: ROK family protein [Thermodesulfobacteriota bacterium]|nr:ROK family protein [Thermodesulfobacteriota bacterium]
MNKIDTQSVAIGVDLGGTNLRTGIVDQRGNILKSLKRQSQAKEGKENVINRITDLLIEACSISNEFQREVKGICIGAPGFLNIKKGIISESPNLPGWKDVALKKEIEKRRNFPPIVLQNDANCFTFGEWWTGAGNGYKNIAGITLGTGVGGGVILGNRIWLGDDGTAGEIGHIIVEPSGLKCECGRNGCLESYASGTAIVKQAVQALKKGEISTLKNRVKENLNAITAKMVSEEAAKGDRLSLDIMNEAGRYLGIAIASIINLLNIGRFVIGGRVAGSGDSILEPAREEVLKRAINPPIKDQVIVQARLGDDAGIIGAAGMIFHNGYSES